MELKNVTRYIPDDQDYDNNFLYFRSEDGQDFYESLSKFTKKYKLCIDSENIIRSVAEDVSRLYPAGFRLLRSINYQSDLISMAAGNIRTALFWLFPLTIRLRPKPPDRNYWMELTAPLPTGELNWHWVKSVTTIRKI